MKDVFSGIVGQDKAKKKLSFLLEGYKATGIMPHLMFVAPKGCGKTTLAKKVAFNLASRENLGNPKDHFDVNCSTIKGIRPFIDDVVTPFSNKEATFILDECSELPRNVTMLLLSMLNPNKENQNTFTYGNESFLIDFRKQTFIFATTEPQTVFHALMDRCERIDLEEYTLDNLGNIISNSLNGVNFKEDALAEASSVLRGNARSAQKMANHIKQYLTFRNKSSFGQSDWKNFADVMGISPLGLNPVEIQVLKILEQSKSGCTLTNIAAKLGLTRSSVQQDFETYLQKLNLMEIVVGGRRITMKGRNYLKLLSPSSELTANQLMSSPTRNAYSIK